MKNKNRRSGNKTSGKLKPNKRIRLWRLLLWAAMIWLGGVWRQQTMVKAEDAAGAMYFDEEGRLTFEAVDNPAVHIAYKTVGWTIKKYNLPIDHEDNITIMVQLQDESQLMEDGKVHTTFYVERETILAKIAEVSMEWLDEIEREGGGAFLDNIMTVCEYGEPMGNLQEDGSSTGEVYYTYDGIAQARGWRNPEDLHQYFDIEIAIPASSPKQEVIPEASENVQQTLDFNYRSEESTAGGMAGGGVQTIEADLSVGRRGSLYSDVFDVQAAIPSSEQVQMQGNFSKYGFHMNYTKVSGVKSYPVDVHVSVELLWKNRWDEDESETVHFTQTYWVDRSYSYYRLDQLKLYELDYWELDNGAIGYHRMDNAEAVCALWNQHFAITEPEYTTEIWRDGGSVDGGYGKPDVPDCDFSGDAQEQVGEILTQSDWIFVDEVQILGEDGAKLPGQDTMIALNRTGVTIDAARVNGVYATESNAVYTQIPLVNAAGVVQEQSVSQPAAHSVAKKVLVNPITVHTPVICDGDITDNRRDNQQIVPLEERISMVLGKDFRVFIQNTGQHIERAGYGNRNYQQYVMDNQVCFPCQVIRRDQYYDANQWISIGQNGLDNYFTLPVMVGEGTYEVQLRTLALNYTGAQEGEPFANLEKCFDVATEVCPVYVTGQVKDWCITDSNDPHWESRLQEVENEKLFVAEGMPLSNPDLRLGYEFQYTFTTVGDMAEGDYVRITPRFYWIPQEYKSRTDFQPVEVDLYEIADNQEGKITFEKLGAIQGAEAIHVTGAAYDGHIKYWRGIYQLPRSTVAVAKGFDLIQYAEEFIVNGRSGLFANYQIADLQEVKSGEIVVHFDIETITAGIPHLSYANEMNADRGYCNMWRQEGYQTRQRGIQYRYGDVVCYLGDQSYMQDYKIIGTH